MLHVCLLRVKQPMVGFLIILMAFARMDVSWHRKWKLCAVYYKAP